MAAVILPTTANGQITYGYLVDLVERYFSAVDRQDLDGVLGCFNADAGFTIQSAHAVHEGRDEGIREMFEELFENYRQRIRHIHFWHVADPDNNRVASQFVVELIDNDDNEIYLTNCNFVYIEGGKFERVYVYMSDGMNVLG
jgi:ketosteroid isomerase-like protein